MADKVQEVFALNIKRYRKIFGYSQMKLGDIVGVSTSLIASYETKTKFPSAKKINKLSQVFGIEPYQLFYDESSTFDKSAKLGALKEELKSEIKHRLQNKLHRCAGPEPEPLPDADCTR